MAKRVITLMELYFLSFSCYP